MSLSNWQKLARGNNNVHVMPKSKGSKKGNNGGGTKKKSPKSAGRAKRAKESYPAMATKMDEKWRAESDAGVLAEASKILDSPERIKRAKAVADEKAKAAAEAAAAIGNVTRG